MYSPDRTAVGGRHGPDKKDYKHRVQEFGDRPGTNPRTWRGWDTSYLLLIPGRPGRILYVLVARHSEVGDTYTRVPTNPTCHFLITTIPDAYSRAHVRTAKPPNRTRTRTSASRSTVRGLFDRVRVRTCLSAYVPYLRTSILLVRRITPASYLAVGRIEGIFKILINEISLKFL